jgi:hypothetical protein
MTRFGRVSHSHRLPVGGEAWERQGRHMPSAHLELDRPYILLAGPSDVPLPAPDRLSPGNDRPTSGRAYRQT